jgi:hypothetical protein
VCAQQKLHALELEKRLTRSFALACQRRQGLKTVGLDLRVRFKGLGFRRVRCVEEKGH